MARHALDEFITRQQRALLVLVWRSLKCFVVSNVYAFTCLMCSVLLV